MLNSEHQSTVFIVSIFNFHFIIQLSDFNFQFQLSVSIINSFIQTQQIYNNNINTIFKIHRDMNRFFHKGEQIRSFQKKDILQNEIFYLLIKESGGRNLEETTIELNQQLHNK